MKPKYENSLKDIDFILFSKYIDSNNIQGLLDLLFEHKIDIDTFYYIVTIENKIQIDDLKFNKCVESINEILETIST